VTTGKGTLGEAPTDVVGPHTPLAHPCRPYGHLGQLRPYGRCLFRVGSRGWRWRSEQFTVLRHRNRRDDARNRRDSHSDSNGHAGRHPGADNLATCHASSGSIQGACLEAGATDRDHVSSWVRLWTSRAGGHPRGTLHTRRAVQHRGALQVRTFESAGTGSEADGPTGNVSWSWIIGTNTTRGQWTITVTCGSASAQSFINVV
jgi:hypothetical protein